MNRPLKSLGLSTPSFGQGASLRRDAFAGEVSPESRSLSKRILLRWHFAGILSQALDDCWGQVC